MGEGEFIEPIVQLAYMLVLHLLLFPHPQLTKYRCFEGVKCAAETCTV